MVNFTIYLEFGEYNTSVVFSSSNSFKDRILKELDSLNTIEFPFLIRQSYIEAAHVDLSVEFTESENYNYIVNSNSSISITSPADKISIYSIIYLMFTPIEGIRQAYGGGILHSAAISKNNEGILILGKEGSGKTSIALELCTKHGYKIIGNDLTCLRKGMDSRWFLYSGTKFFNIRRIVASKYFSSLNNLFKSENKDNWTDKVSILPHELGIEIEKNLIPINKVYEVHINESSKELFVGKLENGCFNRIVTAQKLREYISGQKVPGFNSLLEEQFVVPSFDSKLALDNRRSLTEFILTEKIYLSGCLQDIINFILREEF